jgi:hypothetical protein
MSSIPRHSSSGTDRQILQSSDWEERRGIEDLRGIFDIEDDDEDDDDDDDDGDS